jgi:hypothetical protein
MKKLTKKNLIVLVVFAFVLLAILISDLILFQTSLNETGVGRGFSRYWRQEE